MAEFVPCSFSSLPHARLVAYESTRWAPRPTLPTTAERRIPDPDWAHSALLDDGVDDALGDVDHGFADPRGAAVQLAAVIRSVRSSTLSSPTMPA